MATISAIAGSSRCSRIDTRQRDQLSLVTHPSAWASSCVLAEPQVSPTNVEWDFDENCAIPTLAWLLLVLERPIPFHVPLVGGSLSLSRLEKRHDREDHGHSRDDGGCIRDYGQPLLAGRGRRKDHGSSVSVRSKRQAADVLHGLVDLGVSRANHARRHTRSAPAGSVAERRAGFTPQSQPVRPRPLSSRRGPSRRARPRCRQSRSFAAGSSSRCCDRRRRRT